MESGESRRGALVKKGETWPWSCDEQRNANPTVSAIQDWCNPRQRESLEAGGDRVVDRWRVRNHEHQQASQQEEGNHPAYPCYQDRLMVRKTQHKQAKQLLCDHLPVSLRLRHTHSLAGYYTTRQMRYVHYDCAVSSTFCAGSARVSNCSISTSPSGKIALTWSLPPIA